MPNIFSFSIILITGLFLFTCCTDKNDNKVKILSSVHSDSTQTKTNSNKLSGLNLQTQKEISLEYEDVRGENVFVFRINPQLPKFKFVLFGDSTNYFNSIKIYKNNSKRELQHINLLEEPYDFFTSYWKGEPYFDAKDFNFDGFKDIMMMNCEGTGGRFWTVWIYDSTKNIFRTNKFYLSLSNPVLYPTKKELYIYDHEGDGTNSLSIYKYSVKGYYLLKQEDYWVYYKNEKRIFVRDIKKRINGKMKLVSRKEQNNYFDFEF